MNTMWKQEFTLEGLNTLTKNSMSGYLGIVFTQKTDHYLEAEMPLSPKTTQPMGILHGGASAALAETLGSIASVLMTDSPDQMVLGIDISSKHLKSVSSGKVRARVLPVKIGRTLHLWQIRMYDEQNNLCCDSRLTVLIKKK